MDTHPRERGRAHAGPRFIAWTRRAFPDPHGIASFALAGSVLLGYLGLDPTSGPRLFSDFFPLEVLGHVWLLVGPPLAVALACRSFLDDVPSPLALITLPLGALLSVLGIVGTAVGLLHSLHAA